MEFGLGLRRVANWPQAGTGLLAVFCDLPEKWRDDFRPWLSDEMFPPRIAIGFGPAATFDAIPEIAVGGAKTDATPQAYLTCYVAPTVGDLYNAAYQGLRIERAPRDAAYHRHMVNHARYSAAWVGSGIETADQFFAPVIVVDRFDVAPADLQIFNAWYETEFLPACAKLRGLKRLRRYIAMEGTERHVIISEFSGVEDLECATWCALRRSEQWRLCRFAPGAPAVYRKVLDAK